MKKPIEDWMLTAHALGDLEPEQHKVVEAALAEDAHLREELAAIQATLAKVGSALQNVAPKSIDPVKVQALRESLDSALSKPSQSSSENTVQLAKRAKFKRALWVGLTAVAASGVIGLVFAPGVLHQLPSISMSTGDKTKMEPSSEVGLERQKASSLDASAAPAGTANPARYEATEKKPSKAEQESVTEFNSGLQEAQQLSQPYGVDFLQESSTSNQWSEPTANQFDALSSAPAALPVAPPSMEQGRGLATANAGGGYGVPMNAPASSEFYSLGVESFGDGAERSRGYAAGSGGTAEGFLAQSAQTPSLQSLNQDGTVSNLADSYGVAAASGPTGGAAAGKSLAEEPFSKSEQSLMMNRTPRVIIPREEEERLLGRQRSQGDRFEVIEAAPFQLVAEQPVTTFSIDVDTAAYSKIRQSIMEAGSLPNPNAVRIEEMLNYFDYAYAGPTDDKPFAAHLAAAECPWAPQHKLVRIAIQAKKLQSQIRPVSNLVFLLDVSGSMNEPNKLPLVKKAISMLVRQLGENDRVAIVVYAGAAGCVLPSTNGINQSAIMTALDNLQAGGSTNGGEGIQLAYQIAAQNYIKGGINRIVLCTDGDFNVGVTGDESLVQLVERQAKENRVFLTCLGFGMGNLNDSMMEKITNKGNGNYAMIDTELEARKVMVEQINETLVTVAKDVKIQVEFNPLHVAGYRLIGYENRRLANQDFNDDTKDAGEIGAGHSVTALYEIVPHGVQLPAAVPAEDPLRYGPATANTDVAVEEKTVSPPAINEAFSAELLLVKLRYKKPEEDVSAKLEFPMTIDAYSQPVDQDFRWASAIAQFGIKLRRLTHSTAVDWNKLIEQASAAAGSDAYRLEAVDLMRRAAGMY